MRARTSSRHWIKAHTRLEHGQKTKATSMHSADLPRAREGWLVHGAQARGKHIHPPETPETSARSTNSSCNTPPMPPTGSTPKNAGGRWLRGAGGAHLATWANCPKSLQPAVRWRAGKEGDWGRRSGSRDEDLHSPGGRGETPHAPSKDWSPTLLALIVPAHKTGTYVGSESEGRRPREREDKWRGYRLCIPLPSVPVELVTWLLGDARGRRCRRPTLASGGLAERKQRAHLGPDCTAAHSTQASVASRTASHACADKPVERGRGRGACIFPRRLRSDPIS